MRIKRLIKKVAIILLGAAIFTFGVHNIHEVTGITEGGVIGLMLFLNKWFGIPSSIASPVLDIICYAIALKLLGGKFLGWSAVATAAVAGFYRVWESFPHMLPDLSANPFAAAVLGGLFVGVGVGLVVRQGGRAATTRWRSPFPRPPVGALAAATCSPTLRYSRFRSPTFPWSVLRGRW